jgi:hypothetical protein
VLLHFQHEWILPFPLDGERCVDGWQILVEVNVYDWADDLGNFSVRHIKLF